MESVIARSWRRRRGYIGKRYVITPPRPETLVLHPSRRARWVSTDTENSPEVSDHIMVGLRKEVHRAWVAGVLFQGEVVADLMQPLERVMDQLPNAVFMPRLNGELLRRIKCMGMAEEDLVTEAFFVENGLTSAGRRKYRGMAAENLDTEAFFMADGLTRAGQRWKAAG